MGLASIRTAWLFAGIYGWTMVRREYKIVVSVQLENGKGRLRLKSWSKEVGGLLCVSEVFNDWGV